MATSGADSPWSWVIAASCCWVTFVIQGLVRSGGVVYVALIDTLGVTRGQASWPFTLRMAIWNLSGPIAGALSYRWSIRAITFTGVLLVTVTNIACWFAKDIYIITLFLGGLQGFGVGMAVTLVPVMINQYFVKYKSTGAGIACAGATAGSFALPPIVEFAIEEYGLGGSFLMMAGITLHGILGASLMRPAEWLSRKKLPAVKNNQGLQKKFVTMENKMGDQNLNFLMKSGGAPQHEETENLLGEDSNAKDASSKTIKVVRFTCEDGKGTDLKSQNNSLISYPESSIISDNDETIDDIKTSIQLERIRERNGELPQDSSLQIIEDFYVIDQNDNDQLANGKLQFIENELNYDPQINLSPVHAHSNHDNSLVISSECKSFHSITNGHYCHAQKGKSSRSCFKGAMEPIKAACEILKNPMFLIIASNYSLFFLSYMTYLIIIVDYSLDLGIDRTDCVFLVSTFSIADLVGRLGSGWITDSGIIKRKHLMMVNMMIVGGLLIATSFAKTYAAVTAVSVCTGLVVGVNLILFYALLEEYLGLRKLPMAIGLMNFSIGVISLVTPLLTGYFRDTMGSYDHLFHLLGSVSVFCGLLWTLEPLSTKCKKTHIAPA